VGHSASEASSRLRDAEDTGEIRMREGVRRSKAEAEEESREKVRTAVSRCTEETDAVRAELEVVKRKLEETARECDNAKRAVGSARG
jgi:hypothetical protein